MTMTDEQYGELMKKYEGKWVAVYAANDYTRVGTIVDVVDGQVCTVVLESGMPFACKLSDLEKAARGNVDFQIDRSKGTVSWFSVEHDDRSIHHFPTLLEAIQEMAKKTPASILRCWNWFGPNDKYGFHDVFGPDFDSGPFEVLTTHENDKE